MPDNISEHVSRILTDALAGHKLGPSDDFFDHGINSLTIVELQIRIEKAVQLQVPTSKLMLHSSIDGWVKAYGEAATATC